MQTTANIYGQGRESIEREYKSPLVLGSSLHPLSYSLGVFIEKTRTLSFVMCTVDYLFCYFGIKSYFMAYLLTFTCASLQAARE